MASQAEVEGNRGSTIIAADTAITPRLVIAIDFGTYASGYVYQWRSDFEADRLKIKCNEKWEAVGFSTDKTPTCLLLNPERHFVSFGYEAEKKFSELEINGKKPDDWYLFKQFKMCLYKRDDLSNETFIEDSSGKHLPLVDILSLSIKYMKDHALKHLAESGLSYPEADTKWVLTVPAIWSDPAKILMRNAAEKAGIKRANLIIALEPECAAIYCSHLPCDQLQIEGDKGKLKYAAEPGSVVMVVDMGGGTVDITTVEIEENGTMKQIFTSGGGHWGGMKVNERFLLLFKDIVGEEALREWSREKPMDEYEFRMKFEFQKKTVIHQNEKGANDLFLIKLPSTLKDKWEKKEGKKITDILQRTDLVDKVEFKEGRLLFSAEYIRRLFNEAVDEIIGYVEWALREDQNKGVPINCILLVGGFAYSNLVVKSIRDGLKEKGIPVVRPPNSELAVLNGAVLFGQNEETITSRIMRYTYGVAMVMEFNPKMHKEEHKFQMNGKDLANNVFRKHVTKGQSVKLGEWVSVKEYWPLDKTDQAAAIHIFASDSTDPIHTTDDGCRFIGKLDLNFSKPQVASSAKRPTVEVSMRFGGTELKIKAKDKYTGQTFTETLKI